MAESPHTLSLIVPCLNEADGLDTFLQRCEGVAVGCPGCRFEYLFVDDGSSDDTWKRITALAGQNPRVRGLRLARNYGQQRAITAGVDACTSDYTAILDADLQDPPELLPRMLALLDEGYDLVHTVRQDRASDSTFKRWTAFAFYRVMRRWILPELPENAGDFKAFNRTVREALGKYPEHVRFLRGMLATVGHRQATIAYTRPARHAGGSKYPLRMMLRLTRDALFSNSALPLRWIFYVGCIALAAWPVVAGATLVMAGFSGVYLLLLAQWVFSAILLMGIGLAGEYFKLLMLEVKQRPMYLVRDAVNIPEGT